MSAFSSDKANEEFDLKFTAPADLLLGVPDPIANKSAVYQQLGTNLTAARRAIEELRRCQKKWQSHPKMIRHLAECKGIQASRPGRTEDILNMLNSLQRHFHENTKQWHVPETEEVAEIDYFPRHTKATIPLSLADIDDVVSRIPGWQD